jgi:uncharacterized protein (DUF302 family)
MYRLSAWALFLLLGAMPGAVVAQPVVTHARTDVRFEDVRDDLKAAIEARGFVVDYQARIGAMLERTGKDLGTERPLYADAHSLQFCSAQLSRKMMEADPANVVMCPFTLVVYATAANPSRVYVSYRRALRHGGSPASRAALHQVDVLLDELAREALGKK